MLLTFFKGLLLGAGWVVGSGLTIMTLFGLLVFGESVSKRAAKYRPVHRKPRRQQQPLIRHHARFLFFVRFPATEQERMEMRERRTRYFS